MVMTAPRLMTLVAALSLAAVPVCAESEVDQPKQAMFKTKAEAEAAAPGFGCSGAHPMGEMWMVCSKHNQADPHQVH